MGELNETLYSGQCAPCSQTLLDNPDNWTPEVLAQSFHAIYERLAPSFGYETREASAKPWADVPEQNKQLMIAVCGEIIGRFAKAGGYAHGIEAAAKVADEASNWKAGPHAPKGFDVLNRGKNQNGRSIAAAIRALAPPQIFDLSHVKVDLLEEIRSCQKRAYEWAEEYPTDPAEELFCRVGDLLSTILAVCGPETKEDSSCLVF